MNFAGSTFAAFSFEESSVAKRCPSSVSMPSAVPSAAFNLAVLESEMTLNTVPTTASVSLLCLFLEAFADDLLMTLVDS